MRLRAFTLIEILVVIAIIGVISSVVLASLNLSREKGSIAAGKKFGASLEHALGDRAVGAWNFDECSGTSSVDGSGNSRTLSLVGGATFSTDTPLSAGCALSLNGTTGYTTINQPFSSGPNDFTVSFWLYPNSQYARFITPYSNGIDQWVGYDEVSRRIEVMLSEAADTNSRARYSTTGSVPAGKWTHVAVSIKDLNVKIYINGSLNAQYTEASPIGAWTDHWTLGQRGNATSWLSGRIDNLRIYAGTM